MADNRTRWLADARHASQVPAVRTLVNREAVRSSNTALPAAARSPSAGWSCDRDRGRALQAEGRVEGEDARRLRALAAARIPALLLSEMSQLIVIQAVQPWTERVPSNVKSLAGCFAPAGKNVTGKR